MASADGPGEQGSNAEPSGRELLRNFLRRRDLGLLPGQKPLLAALPPERRAPLQEHPAFGYDSGPTAPASQGAHSGSSGLAAAPGGGDAALAELETRRDALQAQVAELEEALAAERAKGGEAGERLQSTQQAMGSAVDEHGALSRALGEARARSAELQRERERLEAALLAQRGAEEAPEEEEPQPTRRVGEAPAGQKETCAADVAEERAAELAVQRLALHRAYLLRLDAESRELQQRCAQAEAQLGVA
mmetsp:Transcript_2291/g.5458  ORF Transcript_2291/g.5458 Transcript_2291/m.5458 type:complete len:248 (-) Transcript_2291:97-840(-)